MIRRQAWTVLAATTWQHQWQLHKKRRWKKCIHFQCTQLAKMCSWFCWC
jgi:hypothetical protein